MSKPLAKTIIGKDGTEYEVCDAEARRMAAEGVGDKPTDAKFFDIDHEGILALKPEYRGSPANATYSYAVSDRGVGMDGSLNIVLPEKIVLPKDINGKAVKGFQKGMFYCNQRIKEIVFPDTVTAIPEAFSMTAYNLCDITNTDHITSVGTSAFESARIKSAIFPLLSDIGDRAFCNCMYLQVADIGAQITAIPDSCFRMGISLATVNGGDSVTEIKANAFRATYKLKWLPLMDHVTLLGDQSFILSGFPYDWDELKERCTFGSLSTPVQDNEEKGGSNYKYWVDENGKDVWTAGVESSDYKAAQVPIITALSQRDPRWVEKKWGTTTQPYASGCGVIVSMHVHSIFSGKMYHTPQEFEADIKAINPALLDVKTTGSAKPVNDLLVALGYSVEMITDKIATAHLKKLYAALSGGGCAVFTMNSSTSDTSHWVVAYGVTADGQIMVLNSDCGSHLINVYDDVELMTHTAPLQNITGPGSDIIIVRKTV